MIHRLLFVKFLGSYLEDRKIVVRNSRGTVMKYVYTGVPHGPTLGSLLWNLVCDVLLMELQDIHRLNVVAFADDLALILDVANQEESGISLGRAMNVVMRWCADNGLVIAHEKTKVILLTGKHIPKVMDIQIEDHPLRTKKEISYLGVQLDRGRSFGAHFEKVCGKAYALMGALNALLPNVNGPTGSVKKLYYGVGEPEVLYESPVWAKSLLTKSNRNILKRAQRAAFIRSCTAYRTVSHEALCVLTGTMPNYY